MVFNMSINHPTHRARWELKAIFAFGVIFVMVMILVAIYLPQPTTFQQTIFRTVLSLAAAGVGALVPGFLIIRYKNFLRAGGALAVFAIVFFFNPTSLVIDKSPHPTDPFKITVIFEQSGEIVKNSYDFPISDIKQKKSGADFLKLLKQLPNIPESSIQSSTVFRTSDEVTITADGGDVLDDGNTGVLVIPKSIIKMYDSPHLAFTHIYSQMRKSQ